MNRPGSAAEQSGGIRAAIERLRALASGLEASRTTGLAAQMAFWLFLSLLPLAAVGGLVLARVAIAHEDITGEIVGTTPPAVRDLIATQLAQVARWNGGTVGPLAAVVFVWLASSGVHSVFDALEAQGRVARPWWKKRLIAIAACVGLSAGVALIALLRTGLGWLSRVAGRGLPVALSSLGGTWTGEIARVLLAALVAFGLIAGLYLIGTPVPRGRRRVVVPGTLLAMALQLACSLGYRFYIRVVGTGSAYQAGLGIIGVTLTFLYLSSLALLLGAELNRVVVGLPLAP